MITTTTKVDSDRLPKPVSRYYRSKNGKVIHHWTCLVQGMTSVPWLWAGDMGAAALREVIATRPWLRPCLVCRPDSKSWTEPS